MNKHLLLIAALCVLPLSGCGRPDSGGADTSNAAPATAPGAAGDPAAPQTPDSTAGATSPANDEALSPDTAKNDAGGTATGAAGTAAAATRWNCGDKTATTTFDNGTQTVRVEIDGKTLELPSAQSGSGARYADTQGNEFWEHQGEATLSAGGNKLKCTPAGGNNAG